MAGPYRRSAPAVRRGDGGTVLALSRGCQWCADLGRECAFDLKLIAPKLPPFDVPAGHTEASWLRELTMVGALERYGPPEGAPKAYKQLEHELAIIEGLNFPGYFLVVHDIVSFCKNNDILCQGRGSAANSAVCYAIGITNVDPVRNKLLFERFLAPERDGPPDIDVDIESDRREEAIQHVYAKYGRTYAAQVANVITYRGKSSVRDMARALGFSQGQQDAWSKQVGRWGGIDKNADTDIPRPVLELAAQIEGYPRHLGIHSGGMVICDRPIADVCPVEWARMANRSVLQWDKDDCAAAGLVKFDLLGLGMLSALHYMMDLVAEHKGITVDLAQLDLSETAVYEMLQRADSVGVFQVESRAQMATLPRLKPSKLLRPGSRGRAHPSGADSRRISASVHSSAQQTRTCVLRPSVAREGTRTHVGGSAVPGTVDADGRRRCGLHAVRGRSIASGNGIETLHREDGTTAREVLSGHARPTRHR